MTDPKTKEHQYDVVFRVRDKHGITRLGLMVNESWNQDPRRTLFMLARYKFVAKLMDGRKRVLEVGCADAFGTRLVQQTTDHVTAVDFDAVFVEDIRARANPHWPLETFVHDMLGGPVPPSDFDGAFALDVLEHIRPEDERVFLDNFCASLAPTGLVVIGMPSLESQVHASGPSKAGHVNCKTGQDLKRLIEDYFHTVLVFSMNDEIVHTGFYPMAHYLLAVGTHLKGR
jgi:SAM-dependent methyltransferase